MLLDLSAVSLPWLIFAFALALAGAVILLAGTRQADRIADRTGMGDAQARRFSAPRPRRRASIAAPISSMPRHSSPI